MRLKSRDLPILDYFNILQREYLVSMLRAKIYQEPWRGRYSQIAEQKREKIDDIATRNTLPSIFDDTQVKREMYKQVYTKGYPNFIYRDSKDENKRSKYDFYSYYSPQSDVIVDHDKSKDLLIGKVVSANFDAKTVTVEIEGEQLTTSREFCRRVL